MAERPDYEDLEMRVSQSKKHEKRLGFLVQYWYILLVTPIIYTWFSAQILNRTLSLWEPWALFSVVTALWILGVYKSIKGSRKYNVRQDEWALFYCKSTLRWLNKKAQSEELRKEYRRNAVKSMEELISVIEKKWKIGSFYLAKNFFKPIPELKENLRHKILPILKDGSDEMLAVAKQIIRDFLAYSMNLSIEGIIKTNEEISMKIKEVQTLGGHPSFSERVTELINTHRLMTGIFFVTTVTVGCIFFFYAMVTYVGIVKEYAFGGSIAIFIGLLTIYFTKRGRG